MSAYEELLASLEGSPRRWLITGVAGFIGSNLLEKLLETGQEVVGLDNYSTGKRKHCQDVMARWAGASDGSRVKVMEGDIRSAATCREACRGVDYVLHQAAQVSVPQSMADPMETHETNVTGFLNMLLAARESGVRRFVYASSCAVYGESTQLPLGESEPANPLSPYAASKLADEIYAGVATRAHGLETVGLRYFNVFGPRQDPRGAYAAVIPHWVSAMLQGAVVRVHGDGSTTRDFCHVANVVQANLLAATAGLEGGGPAVVNVAAGARTSLNELFELLRMGLLPGRPALAGCSPVYEAFRPGDIRHSQADISGAKRLLGYAPTHDVKRGLQETLRWYTNTPGALD